MQNAPTVRRAGNVIDMNIAEGPCHGPLGAPTGFAYIAGAHGRVQHVVMFPFPEPLPDTSDRAETVSAILDYLPEDTIRARVVGGTVMRLSLLDPEEEVRTHELDSRWCQLAAFLIRSDGKLTIPVREPDLDTFDKRTGTGILVPQAAGARLLGHSIVLPNPYPHDIASAVLLSGPESAPMYGALHRKVPEWVVERDEVAA